LDISNECGQHSSHKKRSYFDQKYFVKTDQKMTLHHRLKVALPGLSRRPQSLRSFSSSNGKTDLSKILQQLKHGYVSLKHAEDMIQQLPASSNESPEQILQSFANLDHSRSARTGFPEAVFGEGKTADQIARILDDMALKFNERMCSGKDTAVSSQRAILATRVTSQLYHEMQQMELHHGRMEYHDVARVVTVIPTSLQDKHDFHNPIIIAPSKKVVLATAGTTDLPVAEEAAVTLEAAGCQVDRIADVGVAGLHRILKALPRLQDPAVGCVIVCAGMDGALPSVVGGLVSCPVIAVPTSIGYGISLGGISAMLTMLNSCSPGVAVQNIDNGFGAAAFAYKCIMTAKTT
jgi:NCAIR mutase (PurE)-related protein